MMTEEWEIIFHETPEGDCFVSASLGEEWVDFPINHHNALWLGRFIKHAVLMEIGEEMHNAFCRVCTW